MTYRGVEVADDGPRWARLVLIGEAPGEREVEARPPRPFLGAAGWRLREWMDKVGLKREETYITNTFPFRPPGNKLEAVPWEERAPWIERLHDRLATLEDPWLVVPMGNHALKAITGRVEITNWRGSILNYTDRRGRQIKVIPTIHPSATFKMPGLERRCLHDWARIAADLGFREKRLPQRDHRIHVQSAELEDFVVQRERALERGEREILAVDIENPKPYRKIVCVGFAVSATESLTVTTAGDEVEWLWVLIKRLCELPTEKVLQNGLYDQFHLNRRGIQLVNWYWDTMYLHHVLDPADAHSLEYLGSIFTREPFWKKEGKEEGGAVGKNFDEFLTYCGKDACVTRELFDTLVPWVDREGLMEFYFRHYVDAWPALAALTETGMRVDDGLRRRRLADLIAERIRIEDELEAVTGTKLYATKGLSPVKLKRYLYETLALPKKVAKRGGGEATVTTNEVAVRQLLLKHPDKLGVSGPLILAHRRTSQLGTFFSDQIMDEDGRMRSKYGLNTEEGRSNSGKNPTGSGRSAQNIDREARDIFLADDGAVGVEVDASQIESRFVYAAISQLTGDNDLLHKARARPDEYDQHTENAVNIFSAVLKRPLGARDITKEQRFLGKKVSHAAQRGMQGKKLAEELLKDGYVYTATECQALVDAYLARLAGIFDYFRDLRRQIIEHRRLQNSWGRRLLFPHDRLNDDTFRRGYSFEPQSECFDRMEQFGLIPFYHQAVALGKARLNAFVHDSLWFSVRPEEAWEVTKNLVTTMEQPRMYRGVELAIPTEVKVGLRWKGSHEWKRLPKREEFEEVVYGLARRREGV